MTNKQIWEIALMQSAEDFGCSPQDFISGKNLVVPSEKREKARRYLPLPFELDMVSYGSNIVAQTSPRLEAAAREYIGKYNVSHCFETPHIHALDEAVGVYGLGVCFMAEYFLPDAELVKEQPCGYEMKLLGPSDFAELYTPQWSNALCSDRKALDVLAVGAYDGGKLIGLAGASADCESMYQIGVDVLPGYRRQGIAAALTGRIALEIFALGKVPFYCAAWCNIASVRNAVRCGFRPAWAELTVRENELIAKLNRTDSADTKF